MTPPRNYKTFKFNGVYFNDVHAEEPLPLCLYQAGLVARELSTHRPEHVVAHPSPSAFDTLNAAFNDKGTPRQWAKDIMVQSSSGNGGGVVDLLFRLPQETRNHISIRDRDDLLRDLGEAILRGVRRAECMYLIERHWQDLEALVFQPWRFAPGGLATPSSGEVRSREANTEELGKVEAQLQLLVRSRMTATTTTSPPPPSSTPSKLGSGFQFSSRVGTPRGRANSHRLPVAEVTPHHHDFSPASSSSTLSGSEDEEAPRRRRDNSRDNRRRDRTRSRHGSHANHHSSTRHYHPQPSSSSRPTSSHHHHHHHSSRHSSRHTSPVRGPATQAAMNALTEEMLRLGALSRRSWG